MFSNLNIWKRPLWMLGISSLMAICMVVLGSHSGVYAQTIILDTQGEDELDQGSDGGGTSQKDLTGVSLSGTTFGFAWDETSLSGNNSIDACTYFLETDGDITAVCNTVNFSGNSVSGSSFEIYDCGTAYANGKCTSNPPVSTDYDVTCTAPAVVPSYFSTDTDSDLEVECTVTGIGMNDPDTLQYINTCSKSSESPSSDANDCIFTSTEPDPGFLQLVKVVNNGSAVPADFTLTAVTTEMGGVTISGNGDTGVQTAPAGTYALSESTVGNYSLISLVCVTDGVSTDVTMSQSIDVASLETTVCTFTNEDTTAVLLMGVTATATGDSGASISWTTLSEIDNAGFNVYSSNSADGPWTKVNESLIQAQGDSTGLADYTFTDANGAAYYKLDSVDLDGNAETVQGPISTDGFSGQGLSKSIYVPLF